MANAPTADDRRAIGRYAWHEQVFILPHTRHQIHSILHARTLPFDFKIIFRLIVRFAFVIMGSLTCCDLDAFGGHRRQFSGPSDYFCQRGNLLFPDRSPDRFLSSSFGDFVFDFVFETCFFCAHHDVKAQTNFRHPRVSTYRKHSRTACNRSCTRAAKHIPGAATALWFRLDVKSETTQASRQNKRVLRIYGYFSSFRCSLNDALRSHQ